MNDNLSLYRNIDSNYKKDPKIKNFVTRIRATMNSRGRRTNFIPSPRREGSPNYRRFVDKSAKNIDDWPTPLRMIRHDGSANAARLHSKFAIPIKSEGVVEWVRLQKEYILGLSNRDKQILAFYTHNGDVLINNFLRGSLTDLAELLIKNKKSTIIIGYFLFDQYDEYKERIILPPDRNLLLTPEGNINEIVWDKIVGDNIGFMRVPANVSSLLIQLKDELSRIIEHSPRLINPLIVYRGIKDETHLSGLDFVNNEFISTSVLINSALQFADQIHHITGNTHVSYYYGVYEITLGPTIPCIYMESITMHEYEYEILLPPGLLFKTDSKIFYKKLVNAYISPVLKSTSFAVIIHATVEPSGEVLTDVDNNIIDAAHFGNVVVVERLLRDPRINPAAFRNQAIEEASQNGHIEVVELLLRDPRVNPAENNNNSLILALRYKRNNYMSVALRLLQDPRVDPSAQDNYPIRQASADGNIVLVDRLLLDPRVDPSAKKHEGFLEAVSKGFTNVVDRLLRDPRVDPATQDNFAIRHASYKDNAEMIDRLLRDPRIDPSANDNESIQTASIFGHLSVIERLLQDPRVDPSANENRSIISASTFGDVRIVERLLQDPRVDPSAKDNLALRIATNKGHVAVVELLMRDPRVANSQPKMGGSYLLYNKRNRRITRKNKQRKMRT